MFSPIEIKLVIVSIIINSNYKIIMIAGIIATGHCAKYFILVNKFDLYNNPMRWVTALVTFYR